MNLVTRAVRWSTSFQKTQTASLEHKAPSPPLKEYKYHPTMASGRHTDREAFDRSFEIFEGDQGLPPWSDNTWAKNTIVNTSFETDIFEFSAASVSGLGDEAASSSVFFPDDPFGIAEENSKAVIVRVAIHEQVSALYNDATNDGAVQVDGSIRVKPSFNIKNHPFCLLLRDVYSQIERIECIPGLCGDITHKISRQQLHKSDRVLRVTIPPDSKMQEIVIAKYSCTSKVRPIPLLIKTKVHASDKYTRVGFKVRANPTNTYSINRVAVIMAVPLDVDGESVRISRIGGVYDELKRTITWQFDRLLAGEVVEIQAQFIASDENDASSRTGKFPVLVRGDIPALFSDVELSTDYHDSLSTHVDIKLNESGRLLHRKL